MPFGFGLNNAPNGILNAQGGGSVEPFANPWATNALACMPETIQDAHRWVEAVLLQQPTYRAAVERCVSYFITNLVISDTGQQEKKEYESFLTDSFGLLDDCRLIGLDYCGYGQSYTSVTVPFRRFLMCPNCAKQHRHTEFPLSIVFNNPQFHFRWQSFNFHATCPKCAYSGQWDHIDRRDMDENKLRLHRWNVHEIELLWDPITEDVGHIWRIPEYYKQLIRQGKLFHLERVPWEIVEAIRDNNYILFDPGVLYHMKDRTLCGVQNRGYGISRVLLNFGQSWYLQVIRRMNEAIGTDYIMPFRMITPLPKPGSDPNMTDPLLNADMGGVVGMLDGMLRRHRRDPAGYQVFPYPLQYQVMGGEANELAPFQILDKAEGQLLNAIQCPVEFYKMNVSVTGAPMMFRMMESTWSHFAAQLQRLLPLVVWSYEDPAAVEP